MNASVQNQAVKPRNPSEAISTHAPGLELAPAQGATRSGHGNDESNLWLPPRRMRQYQWMKALGGLLIGMLFLGWLVLQGSNPVMRTMTAGLICVTLWVVVRSITDDQRRNRGRQIEVAHGELRITSPQRVVNVLLSQVAVAKWCDDPESGLTFYDRCGCSIAHLDSEFLIDQAEARCFLRWARQQAQLPFNVQWPS